MLGLFDSPFSYRIFSYPQRRPMYIDNPFFGITPVVRRSFLDTLLDPLATIYLYNDNEDEEDSEIPQSKEEATNEHLSKSPDEKPAEESELNVENEEETKQVEEKKKAAHPKKSAQRQQWCYSKVFSSHSLGGVEEVREKTYDSRTGDTIESQTRRIGDRWCRIDTTTSKDGHNITKETWHNVSDEETDSFKTEWVKRRGICQSEESSKPLEHTNESKDETVAPPPSE